MNLDNDQTILESVIREAWKDSAFKNNLIQNPINTIENFIGHPINLPQGKTIAFVDQTDSSTIYINIPAETNSEDMELSEEQLDVISGGIGAGDPPPVIMSITNHPDDNIFG